MAEFPHCDMNVLHAPGACVFCDKFPQKQQERVEQKINFTGETDPDKRACPATAARPVTTIHKWGGNAPITQDQLEERDRQHKAMMKEVERMLVPENGNSWKVLDHGYVKLIDSMGQDETIVEAARMSTGKGFISWNPYYRCDNCGYTQIDGETYPLFEHGCAKHKMVRAPRGDLGLLETLWENGHHTPFEMVELAVEIQAPISVFRELVRHRTFNLNEFSARYSQMPDLHYIPPVERIAYQSGTNKQGSGERLPLPRAVEIQLELRREQREIYEFYDELIEEGVAKETARQNTPVSRYSKARVKCDLRNWFNFLRLRMDPAAQWEIRQFANIIAEQIVARLWPKAWELFEEHTLYGKHFSRTEVAAMMKFIQSQGGTNPAADLEEIGKKAGMDERRAKKFRQKLGF